MSSNDIETKLSAARTRLILDKPFLGALVLRLPMISANPGWCKTTATDARSFYYNPDYIRDLSLDQTQFVLAHEALHCALSHFARRQHRVKHRWDLACDFAINPILLRDGLVPAPDALYLQAFEDMTAEEIYPMLDDMPDQQTMDQHIYDEDDPDENQQGEPLSGSGKSQQTQTGEGNAQEAELDRNLGGAPQPPPLSGEEKEQLSIQWRQRMAGAAQQAMQAGKMSGALARLVDHLLQPQLPWRMLLARYMTAVARDDYNYTRPSRREGAAILPSLRSAQVDVVVAIDTSGSIGDAEIKEFMAEIDAIKAQVRARITLLACDQSIDPDAPWEFETWDEFKMPKQFSGGGGTSFCPVFDWLDRKGRQPDLLVYFTDAEGRFPRQEAVFPVIWLVKGKSKVPWGQRIQLN
jgi:predicted metal-dependent peptidase